MGPCASVKYVRVGRDRGIKIILGRRSPRCVKNVWRKPGVKQSAN